jgi:hypothetical protein
MAVPLASSIHMSVLKVEHWFEYGDVREGEHWRIVEYENGNEYLYGLGHQPEHEHDGMLHLMFVSGPQPIDPSSCPIHLIRPISLRRVHMRFVRCSS